jgi:hypothetical protein
VLQLVRGDVDAAIERVIEIMGAEEWEEVEVEEMRRDGGEESGSGGGPAAGQIRNLHQQEQREQQQQQESKQRQQEGADKDERQSNKQQQQQETRVAVREVDFVQEAESKDEQVLAGVSQSLGRLCGTVGGRDGVGTECLEKEPEAASRVSASGTEVGGPVEDGSTASIPEGTTQSLGGSKSAGSGKADGGNSSSSNSRCTGSSSRPVDVFSSRALGESAALLAGDEGLGASVTGGAPALGNGGPGEQCTPSSSSTSSSSPSAAAAVVEGLSSQGSQATSSPSSIGVGQVAGRAGGGRAGSMVGGAKQQQKKGNRHRQEQEQRDKQPSRNKLCPCGSKKKYKSCCGVAAAAAARRQQLNGEQLMLPGEVGEQLVAQVATLCI